MAISTARFRNNSNFESHIADYTSIMVQLFVETLEQRQDVQILDVGPVCGENIMFFAHRVTRLYVCDMFLRLDRNRRKGLPSNKVWGHLNYSPQSFDGIHLWDLCDHLNDLELGRMADLCHTMLKPKGLVMVVAYEEQLSPLLVNSFVIRNDYRLKLRPQPHLNLPWYYRHNRALTSLLAPFTAVKSLRYHNGIREFLFQPG